MTWYPKWLRTSHLAIDKEFQVNAEKHASLNPETALSQNDVYEEELHAENLEGAMGQIRDLAENGLEGIANLS